MNDVLHQLREADPARSVTGHTEARVTADVAAILLAHPAGDAATGAGPTGTGSFVGRRPVTFRVMVAAVSVAAVSAVGIAADVVSWPWTRGGAESAAYAVTRQADGSVDVRVRWDQAHDPKGLQAALRAAGVPAVVLVESPRGTCDEPIHGDPSARAAIRPAPLDGPRQTYAVVIRPDLLPPGGTVVVGLAFPGETDAPDYLSWYVTEQTPPTCIPQH